MSRDPKGIPTASRGGVNRTIHMSHAGEDDDQPPEGVGSEWYGVKVWASDPLAAHAIAAGMTPMEADCLSKLNDLEDTLEGLNYGMREVDVPITVRSHVRDVRSWLLSLPTLRAMSAVDVRHGPPLATGVR